MTAEWLSPIPVLSLGFVLGLKHALDADHLAAVSTIVSERKSLWSSSLVGMFWGIGHTLSLLVAGVAVIFLHVEMGERLALGLELGVAAMLVGLGLNTLYKLGRGARLHMHAHEHGGRLHVHPHVHDGERLRELHGHHSLRFGARPLLVGVVHGLAGSAAVMLLVLSAIPSPALGMAYIGVFGFGTVGGMLVMSALMGLPAHLTAARFAFAHVAVRSLAGCFSLGLGLFMAYDVGFVRGLLG
jgi:sulfite exporter TauE/SafE